MRACLALIAAALVFPVGVALAACVPDEPLSQPAILSIQRTIGAEGAGMSEARFEPAGPMVTRTMAQEWNGGIFVDEVARYRGLIVVTQIRRGGASEAEAASADPDWSMARTIVPAEIDAAFPLTPGQRLTLLFPETVTGAGETLEGEAEFVLMVHSTDPVEIGGCSYDAVQLTEVIRSPLGETEASVVYLPNLQVRYNAIVRAGGETQAVYEPLQLAPSD